MRSLRGCNAEGGFTLLELLISMTVLSLLLVVVFGGLTFGARAWERTLSSTSSALDIKAVQSLLRSRIEQAYPLYVMKAPGEAFVFFEGRPDGMAFLAPPPQVFAEGGRARFDLRSTVEQGAWQLHLSLSPELGGTGSGDEVLFAGARAISFSYFGNRAAGETPAWHDSWQMRQSLPRLIRISAEFPEGDGRFWPELIVAPQISVDASCNFDPLTKYCSGR